MCTALCNLRQRRQHEVQIGKDWIERAKLADGDENDVEMDKINYKKFCQGLERIDNACIQLDETIMVIKDF
jgi:DNA-directed RNA polymerase III subunit RPC3